MKDGVPHFEEFLRRSGLDSRSRIERAMRTDPVTFVVFDILYLKNATVMDATLDERKILLQNTVIEGEGLAISRTVEGEGKRFFNLTRERGLEGLIAKRKKSIYRPGIRTKDWYIIKNLLDDDFVVCGYTLTKGAVVSLILGQYSKSGELVYKGHVTLSMSSADFRVIQSQKIRSHHPYAIKPPPASNDGAVWIEPILVCRVEFMTRTVNGTLRQPMYRGLRMDKTAEEARERR